MPLWKIDAEKSTDSWLELADAQDSEDSCERWTAVAKWDACVHLHRYGNGENEPDYIHFCGTQDIERWIARLQELLVVARQYHIDHGNAEWGWLERPESVPPQDGE